MATTMHSTMSTTAHAAKDYLPSLARLLLCSLFIWDGVLQLRDPAGTVNYFESLNIPSPQIAVWVSIPVHLLGGIGILIGFMTRWAAALLILLCLGTAFGVHLPAGDPDNMMNFYKNLVMAGGFLYVIAYGPGAFALDDARPRANVQSPSLRGANGSGPKWPAR
jgi:putative oxidoreductase